MSNIETSVEPLQRFAVDMSVEVAAQFKQWSGVVLTGSEFEDLATAIWEVVGAAHNKRHEEDGDAASWRRV